VLGTQPALTTSRRITMPRRKPAQPDGAAPVGPPAAPDRRAQYRFRERFGALIAATGVAGVPRALCHYLGELGLSYADLGFITHLLSYRWTTAYPYPKQRKLAAQAGLTRNGIQRRVYALQSLGYLNANERFDQQSGRRTTNSYDLTPLLDRLNDLILRDWDTVWKHRDPLVADSAEDESEASVQIAVDNPPPGRELSASPGTQDSAIPLPRKSAGARRANVASPADSSGQHGLDTPEPDAPPDDDPPPDQDASDEDAIHRPATATSRLDCSIPEELARAIADYSDQFGDRRHLAGNRTRALRLWQESGLAEGEFLRAVYTAGARTATRADRVRGSSSTGEPDGPKNLMPYFFGVLKGVVGEVAAGGDGPTESAAMRKIRLRLAESLHPTLVTGWLAGARVVSHDRASGELVLALTNEVGARKLGVEYRRLLVRAANEAVGDVSSVELSLE